MAVHAPASPGPRLLLLALVAICLARSAVSQACPKEGPNGTYALPALPLPYDAYEPSIDNTTMVLHHTRHHQAYVNNTNGALTRYPGLKAVTLTRLIRRLGDSRWEAGYGINAGNSTLLRNNAGGHWNHAFFWNLMTRVNSTSPTTLSSNLTALIGSTFGGVPAMLDRLRAAGASVFGSGWAWVVVRTDANGAPTLAITTTANQDNPLMERLLPAASLGAPIIGVDVWEHAYYLRYYNVRASYLANWVNLINWRVVQRNFDLAAAGKFDQLYC